MKFFLGERFCKGKKLVCYLFFFAYFAYVIVFIYKIKKWLKYWILRHFIRNSILYIKIYFYLTYGSEGEGNLRVKGNARTGTRV